MGNDYKMVIDMLKRKDKNFIKIIKGKPGTLSVSTLLPTRS